MSVPRRSSSAVTPAGGPLETFRKADLRLRLLLLGDGSYTPGLVRGEESRRLVTQELRHLREAFEAAVSERDEGPAPEVEPPLGDLYEELRRIVSSSSTIRRSRPSTVPAFLTPTEAATALRVSVSSIYRAVRHGEIRAVRPTDVRRGALRIPTGEILRRLEQPGGSSGR